MRIALATCSAFPDGDEDFPALVSALAALDAEAVPAVWDDGGVDWGSFDLTVIRSTWDYPLRYAEFLAWTRRVPRLANPAPLVAWNTTKTYLRDLAGAGVPVVPTRWYEPGDGGNGQFEPPAAADYVVKPAVGAGSRDVGRFRAGADDGAAARHLAGLLAAGRTVMVQPYLEGVDTHPLVVGVGDLPSGHRAVELGERARVGAVQGVLGQFVRHERVLSSPVK
jgi:hypothetical protein